MNGQADVKLIFRFKNESLGQFNRSIYNLEPIDPKLEELSTHFETQTNNGSNGGVQQFNDEEQ